MYRIIVLFTNINLFILVIIDKFSIINMYLIRKFFTHYNIILYKQRKDMYLSILIF